MEHHSLIIERSCRVLTRKSVGSETSQLRVHPTTGLKRAASIEANLLIALMAVWFLGFLSTHVGGSISPAGSWKKKGSKHAQSQLFNERKTNESYIMPKAMASIEW